MDYTVPDLARLLNVNEETVRRWRIRGRNGVRLEVPHADEFPGRKGYVVPASSVREFLAHNPSLMTDAMEASLEGQGTQSSPRLSGAMYSTTPLDMVGDVKGASAAGATDTERVARVLQTLIEEKEAQRARLLEQVAQVEEEIAVLRHYGGESEG